MSTQVERFIDITRDNLSHLIKLWTNVEDKEIKGNGGAQIRLGIDFKMRNKARNAGNGLTENIEENSKPVHPQDRTEDQPAQNVQATETLFNGDSSSSDDEHDIVS